ncbi:MAG: hypothetical protein IKW30_09870 [Lachnospiraceae bacterium]|nr:hypothetical protein [Lachnospiraceae bacterium]
MTKRNLIISFCVIFVLVVSILGWLKTTTNMSTYYPKSGYPDNGFSHFYSMDKNTVDVLFFGSSIGVNGFNTQEFYDQYGIRSYNLSSVQQPIPLSYCWLKEAVKYQQPKVVVVDTRFLYQWHPADILNGDAGAYHVALDKMKFSKSKIESVMELSKLDPSIEVKDFLFTLRYKHEKWKELTEDNIYLKNTEDYNLKGYAPGDYIIESYEPFVPQNPDERKEFDPIMKIYMDKIVALCRENDINLVLVTLVGNDMNDATNNSILEYAQENEIDYINLCHYEHFYAMSPKYPEESVSLHSNRKGSVVIARHLGKILRDRYQLQAVRDEQWENSKEYYNVIKENEELTTITEYDSYLRSINKERYAVLISSKLDASRGMNDLLRKELSNLGLNTIWNSEMDGKGYVAVISDEGIVENTGIGISMMGTFRSGRNNYYIKVPTLEPESSSQIQIDRQNYSLNRGGLNIVVYDMWLNVVVDKVNIASWGDCSLSR